MEDYEKAVLAVALKKVKRKPLNIQITCDVDEIDVSCVDNDGNRVVIDHVKLDVFVVKIGRRKHRVPCDISLKELILYKK